MAHLLFSSHAGADTERAVRLAAAIGASPDAQAAGLKVWVDQRPDGPHRLHAGTPWQEQLEAAIKERRSRMYRTTADDIAALTSLGPLPRDQTGRGPSAVMTCSAARTPLSCAPCAVEKSLGLVASPAKNIRCSKGRASTSRAAACPGKA